MRVAVLRSWEALDDLGAEWNELLSASRADTVFLTWEWLSAWRRAIEGMVEPFVVSVRTEDGRLVGLGPFYRCSLVLRGGLVRYRCLRTLGDYPTGAEYPDWIVHREFETEAARTIASTLAEATRAGHWDLLWLPHLSGWSGAFERITAACAAAGLHWQARPTDFAAIALPDSFEEYVRCLGRSARQKLHRSLRKVFERNGAVFECCERPEQLSEYLEALFELNTRRWAAVGSSGTFVRKPREACFYREFAPVALARGWLVLAGLRLGGRLCAVDIGYRYGGRFFYLQGGFDPHGPQGLGHALRSRIIAHLIELKVQEFDFLGTVTDYKRDFGGQVRYGHQLLVARLGLKTAPLRALRLWPTGRYLRFTGLPA